MLIEKTKSFDQNVNRYRSDSGLIISIKKTLDILENAQNLNSLEDLNYKIMTRRTFPQGTMRVRIRGYRLLFLAIPIPIAKNVHIENQNHKKVVVVGFEKRGKVYEKTHMNEFNRKVAKVKAWLEMI